jgi:protein-S-isoprenylcysteine O-methyltransferase Ste14
MRAVVSFLVMLGLAAAVLLGAGGTLRWPAAWLYVVLITGLTVGTRLVVARRSPDTLKERARFASAEGVEPGDRLLVLLIGMIGPLAVLLVSGLDHRFGWSPQFDTGVQVAGLVCVLGGGLLAGWAMAVNPFFSAVARIQRDRGQVVVAAGPYRHIRHPAYAGSVLTTAAIPVMLGSWWGLVPATLTTIAIVIRTAREDRMLRRGLVGYQAYAAMTHSRLIPGVW